MSLSPCNPFPSSQRCQALSEPVLELVKSAVKLLVWQVANHHSDSLVVSSIAKKMMTPNEFYVLGPVEAEVTNLFMTPVPAGETGGRTGVYR